jgi:hypothetical protein
LYSKSIKSLPITDSPVLNNIECLGCGGGKNKKQEVKTKSAYQVLHHWIGSGNWGYGFSSFQVLSIIQTLIALP